MQPATKVPGANRIYTKRPDWGIDKDCYNILAIQAQDPVYGPYVEVHYTASLEDMEAFNAGRPLKIRIIVGGMPPISVYTENREGQRND